MAKSKHEFRGLSKTELKSMIIELRERLQSQKTAMLIAAVAKTVQVACRFAGYVIMVYFLSMAVVDFAGKDTSINADVSVSADAEVSIKLLENMELAVFLFLLFAVFSVVYGLLQRRLRQKTISRLAWYQAAYESGEDPDRTSSSLTPLGDTNPGDK